ncbi:MAG: transporter permease [Sphingomonas bacterium]|uniref:MFS transporter n=1 Tax=Sphingomonas bacterium TaxID=1895847 RepID=UPI002616829C|nr:MFS transporter [Sphingomonas bacterium]MDB5704052.1 transporter permease [Sphingomonas bacterium]
MTAIGGRTRVRVLLIFMLFLLSAVAFLDRTNISIAGVQMRQEYGLDQSHLGWVFSAFLIGYAAFQVPAGWLAWRYGPRRVLTIGIIWWGILSVATALVSPQSTHALVLLMSVRFLLGAGEAVMYPAGNQFISRWIPVQERGKANGWIFAGVGAGSALSPPLITLIIAGYGWRAAFYACAAIGLVAALAWFILARDKPEEHSGVSPGELAHIRAGLVAPGAPRTAIPWRAILTSGNVWALFFSYFAFGYVVWIFFSWFFIYLAEARHVDLKASAFYSMLPPLMMMLGCLSGGWISDRVTAARGLYLGRSGLAMVSFALTAVFLVLGSMAQSTGLAVVVLAGGAGAMYLSQSSFWSVSADIAGTNTGVVAGFMNMGCQIGGAVTSSLTPVIAAHYGWTAAFAVAGALAVAGGLIWALVNPNRLLIGGTSHGADPIEAIA